MSDDIRKPDEKPGLNPALRTRADATHDTSESTRSPADTASVQHEEGRAWPLVWLIAAVVGVLLVLWILFV